MLSYIWEAKTLKEACENLKNILTTNMIARKHKLCQELNNVKQKDMSITSYTLKNKELCEWLDSINVNVDEDEIVQIRLDSLAPQFSTLRTIVLVRENSPSFVDL